jgi:Kef-type K+ transport system membrane component KefB
MKQLKPRVLIAGLLSIIALPVFSAAAQGTQINTGATVVPVTWDSLYESRNFFDLRDSLASATASDLPAARFYRGIVAHAFNDNDGAIASLSAFLDSVPRGFPTNDVADAIDAIGDSYSRVSHYRESATTYHGALRTSRTSLDSATKSAFGSWAAIGDALTRVPPLRVAWTAQSTAVPIENDSISFAVAAVMNGRKTDRPLGMDPAARFTVIDSSTAAAHSVRMLGVTITTEVGGVATRARVGVIGTLTIGPAVLSNVPVLIIQDDIGTPGVDRVHLGGVIGLPVLSALGSITLERDGHVALSSPGADNDTSAVSNMAIGDGAAILDATYTGRRVPMLLDANARATLLYPSFLSEFSSATTKASLTTYVTQEPGGGIVSIPAYTLPSLALTVGGRSIRLAGVTALMREPAGEAQLFAGTLGRDALRTVARVTLDFAAMTLRFRDPLQESVLPKIVYPNGSVTGTAPVSKVPGDIAFVALLFALFVVPKALQRYRLPSAITSLLMGAGATALGLFHNDPTLHLLSTFGIVALFLFAGLDIDVHELRRQASPLMVHGLVWSLVLTVGSAVVALGFGYPMRPAVLIALALLTPSTGFILSSLPGFGLAENERFAVKTYAIASELLALTVLFFVLQSTSVGQLAFAVAAMLGVVTIIPLMFRLFARLVAPHAPRSEFAFLLMVAIVCAYATTRLGVYYLVGAFLVGIAAQRFRSELPAMSSEKMVDALESFGSVFIPFYFFHAGTEIVREQITLRAITIGFILVVLLIPIRIGITMLQRRFLLRDSVVVARRISVALVPTLVFTLVLADILNTNFGIEKYVLGALVLYTVLNTSIPAFVLHSQPPEFENVEAAEIESRAT